MEDTYIGACHRVASASIWLHIGPADYLELMILRFPADRDPWTPSCHLLAWREEGDVS